MYNTLILQFYPYVCTIITFNLNKNLAFFVDFFILLSFQEHHLVDENVIA